MRTVQVTIQLQRHCNDDAQTTVVPNNNNKVSVNISYATDINNGDGTNNNNEQYKYIMCSLLLQIGSILHIQPSYAPSPYISSIFNEILERWSLQCCEGESSYVRTIKELDDINDGDELILCCGNYYKNFTITTRNDHDLLALIPSKCRVVTVSLVSNVATAAAAAAAFTGNDMAKNANEKESDSYVHLGDNESDSDIEDVTEVYAKKPRADPEVINLDDSDDSSSSEACFWEYDDLGNMKKSASMMNLKSDGDGGCRNRGEDDIISISSVDSDSSSSGVEDVTEIMLAKRNEEIQRKRDNALEINDDDDSDQEDCNKKRKAVGKKRKASRRSPSTAKRRKTKKVDQSPIEVLLEDKDIPICPGAKVTQDEDGDGKKKSDENEVDHSIKQRIVKLLNTGFHGESNEHEARNAMKLARRLMERYNLDQAVLLQERGDGSLNDFSTNNNDDGSALQGGIVTTKIRNRKSGKPPSSLPRWHDFLVQPVCLSFHVEAFKTVARSTPHRAGECSVTFYGIRCNAQLAAYAFKIASERISLMAASYEPPRSSTLARAKQVAETRTARLSYALGIVNGLERDVKEGLRKEEEKRKEKLRKAQRAAQSGEAYHDDDFSDNDVDDCPGGEAQKNQEETNSTNLEKLERENTAHLALIDHHKKIATDVLKVRQNPCALFLFIHAYVAHIILPSLFIIFDIQSKKIKVRSARKHKSISLNRKAYEKGVVDSKEIDLNQQTIK